MYLLRNIMKSSELLRKLVKAGWVTVRDGKGSHKILMHPGKPGNQIVFPDHGTNEIGKGLALKIVKKAGLR